MSKPRIITGVAIIATVVTAWLLFSASGNSTTARSIKVASAKGGVIGTQMRAVTDADQILWNLALNAPETSPLMTGKSLKLLSALPLGVAESREYAACSDGNCTHMRFYNFSDGGTVEAVYDRDATQFVDQWLDPGARPNPSAYLIGDVVDIVNKNAEAQSLLGEVSKAKVAMIPMSTWLADDDCKTDWCVDLTFHDPQGSGKILHVIANMDKGEVARTFFSRGRESRSYQESAELDPNAPRYTDGCNEANGWSVCWEMTPTDAVNFYDATFEGELIFASAKIGQVEAYYPSWPGGYRDELGYQASVPPKFDTRIAEIEDGFEVRQLFTEPFDWPNCICCYRYEQVMTFYDDGSFGTQFVSQGPGCDELSEYRPFWRFDMAVGDSTQDQAYLWNESAWELADIESDVPLWGSRFINGERFATTSGDVTFEWIPEQTDPLGLDEGRIFFVESEGDREIVAGPADTYEPPRRYANGESLTEEESDLAVWYVPVLKTKRGGPWWCQPDPEPEVNPCYSAMRVQRSGKLVQPTEQELAQLRDAPTATPIPSPTPPPTAEPNTSGASVIAVVPTLRPTPRPNTGTLPEELLLNGGCSACHAIGALGEAGKVGPDLSNIANVAAERVPGQSAETYLYNSIIYPNLYIVEDCPNGPCMPNIMPGTYHLTLNETQVDTLVGYMLTLDDSGPQLIAGNESNGEISEGQSSQQPSAPASQANGVPSSTLLLLLGLGLVALAIALILWMLLRRRSDSA